MPELYVAPGLIESIDNNDGSNSQLNMMTCLFDPDNQLLFY